MAGTTLLPVLLLLAGLLAGNGAALGAEAAERSNQQTAYDLYLRGNASLDEGNCREAISILRQSIELDPGYCYAHANLGIALAKLQKFPEAIEAFTFCVDSQYGSGADRFVFHFNRARAWQESGQMQAARRDQAVLKQLDPARARKLGDSHDYLLMDTAYIEMRNDAAKNRLFEDHRTSIAKGKIVVRKVPGAGKNTVEYEAMGLIEGTLDEVSGVLADYAKYPEFVPNVEELIIKSSINDEVVVDWQLQLPMGYVKKYRLKCWAKQEGNRVQRFWRKLPWPGLKPKETIVATHGQWILEVFPGEGHQVLAYYRVYTDPGKVPLGTGWIVDILSEQNVPNIIKRTRQRVKDLFY
jgi:tetratricopeptide (TPR) repeat protein